MGSGVGSGLQRKPRQQSQEPETETQESQAESPETESPSSEAPEDLLAAETPPSPATVKPEEAQQANQERDQARTQPRPVSPLKGRPSPLKGRKLGPRVKGSNKLGDHGNANVVVISSKPTIYVDEAGNRLPDLGPDFMAPIVMVGSGVVSSMGMRPFDPDEKKQLAEAWAPVAHKYAGFLLPYSVELVAFGALCMIMWPRVKELEAKKKAEAELVNKRAAEAKAAKAGMPTNGQPSPNSRP